MGILFQLILWFHGLGKNKMFSLLFESNFIITVSQQLKTCYKCECAGNDQVKLTNFDYFTYRWNSAHKSRITYHDNPWCQGWPHPPSTWSGTINVLHIWTLRMWGSWQNSNHAKELKFGKESHIIMIHDDKDDHIIRVLGQEPQDPPIMDFQDGGEGSWHNSNYARELKFDKQVKVRYR